MKTFTISLVTLSTLFLPKASPMAQAASFCNSDCIAYSNLEHMPRLVTRAVGSGANAAEAFIDMAKSCHFYGLNYGFDTVHWDLYLVKEFEAEYHLDKGHYSSEYWKNENISGRVGGTRFYVSGPSSQLKESKSWHREDQNMRVVPALAAEVCRDHEGVPSDAESFRQENQRYRGSETLQGG